MKQTLFTITIAILSIAAYAQPAWVTSGAPIGDESNFVYTGNKTITFSSATSYADAGNSTDFDFTNKVTVMSWIHPTTYSDWDKIVMKSWTSDIDPWSIFRLTLTNDNDGTEGAIFSVTISGIDYGVTASNTVPLNTWTHVAGTYDGANLKLYINGILSQTLALSGNLDTNSEPVYIGKHRHNNINTFIGKIDGVKIWNTALTETQVFNAMYGTYAPESNIVAVYDFQEGAGTVANDVSQNSHNATLNGSVTWNSNDEITSVCKIKDDKGDIFTASNFGSPGAVQIYKVNDKPNNITLATGGGSLIEGHYWGVFPANGTANYNIELMYDGYKPTWSGENQLDLAYRNNNASGAWANNLGATLNSVSNTLTKNAIATRNEYHLMYEIAPEPGNCLEFDGTNDFVHIPDNSNLDFSGNFSLEAWVGLKNIGSNPNYYSFISKGGAGESSSVNHNYQLGYQYGTWFSGFHFISFFENSSGNNYIVNYAITPELNRWYHLAATFDETSDTYKLYLDGVLVCTNTSATGIPNVQNQPLMIGCSEYTPPNPDAKFANSFVDEVRIWNDVRTATEIQDNMHKEFSTAELSDGATTTNLVAYYNFNNVGTSTFLDDLSPNNLNGTLLNDYSNVTPANGTTLGPIWRESNCFNRWWGTTDNSWADIDNWSKGRTPLTTDNIGIHQVKATPEVVINPLVLATGTLAEVSDLTVGSNAVFTANAGEQITVNDPYTVNGTAILVSPNGNGPSASLITKGIVHGKGKTQAQRYISANNWHYFSSPVTTQNSSIFLSPQNLYSWNEALNDYWSGNNFVNNIMGWTSFSGNFAVGKGYIGYENVSAVKSFDGLVNSGNISISLDYENNTATHSNAMFDGWNLVGNPYPSAIDWTSGSITKTNIDAAIYFYDDNGTGNYDNYRYYVDGGGNDAYYPTIAANEGSRYIPAHQSVFIKSKSGGGTLTFTNACRAHSTTDFYKSALKSETYQEVVRLEMRSGAATDEAVIRFVNGTTQAYDGDADAYKLFSHSADVPQIFSVAESNSHLAINSLPNYDEETVIPMGIRPVAGTVQRIVFTEVPENMLYTMYLEDKLSGEFTEIILNESYEFQAQSSDLITDRFQLVFSKESSDIQKYAKNDMQIFAFEKSVVIKTENHIGSRIIINDLIGRRIIDTRLDSDFKTIDMSAHPNGNYLIELHTPHGKIVKQVFVGKI